MLHRYYNTWISNRMNVIVKDLSILWISINLYDEKYLFLSQLVGSQLTMALLNPRESSQNRILRLWNTQKRDLVGNYVGSTRES